MFKFGFSSDELENTTDEKNENLVWLESEEIKPDIRTLNNINANIIKCSAFNIKYLSDKDVITSLKQSEKGSLNSLLSAEQNHSDLITAVYEGGLKIWECTYDLLRFLEQKQIDLCDKDVLDVGCGAGIIGILSCLKGAKTVFQDYNPEVIKNLTIPNVVLNDINLEKCAFYSGDWGSFLNLQKKQHKDKKFDYIFTCETIYNTDNYNKLVNIFHQLLKKSGVVYLAAKSHYFGVGGGIGQFEETLKMEDIFNYSTCWVCSAGVKRVIIKITLK